MRQKQGFAFRRKRPYPGNAVHEPDQNRRVDRHDGRRQDQGRPPAGPAPGLAFIDADNEIQEAAGCSIEDIFETQGEAAFREGERKVIARLLSGPLHVLATGGGAFQNPSTRAVIAECAVSVWLKADFEVLWERVSRRSNRPMLKTPDPQRTLAELIEKRYPVYALAELTVMSQAGPVEETVARVEDALRGAGYLANGRVESSR